MPKKIPKLDRYYTGRCRVIYADGSEASLIVICRLNGRTAMVNAGDIVFRALELSAVDHDLAVVENSEEFAPATSQEVMALRDPNANPTIGESTDEPIEWLALVPPVQ